MLKKLFASIGVGSATVDTILTTEHFVQGGNLEGRIEVKGGNVEQEISKITLNLMTRAKVEHENGDSLVNHVIESFIVTNPFQLQPNEEKVIPFHFRLNPETPITVLDAKRNKCKVWLETSLDIEYAVDPTDRDYMDVYPTTVISHFIEAMEKNGFAMVKADVEKGYLKGNDFASVSGCYQEMEFKPTGFGFGRVKEIELSFISKEDRTHVLIELDRRFSGDGYNSLTIPNHASYADVETALKRLI